MRKIKIRSFKKIIIDRKIRILISIFFVLFILLSAYITYASFQPIIQEKTVITCNYAHNGYFNYVVYLKDNTIYNNASILFPEKGNIFRKITDNINASFSYIFNCDKNINLIDVSYMVVPEIKTSLWNKTCDLIVKKSSFDSDHFSIDFPIDYVYYENIVKNINNETGVIAMDPILVIRCNIVMSAETIGGNIYESFSPSISIPLGEDIIEINGNLTQLKMGSLEDKSEVLLSGSDERGNIWVFTLLLLIVAFVLFIIFTKAESVIVDACEKKVKKIKKKYGEWIVEVEKPPKRPLGADLVSTKTLDDLIKVSEELGKPVIYYFSSSGLDKKHSFFVLDETTYYEYNIK